MSGARELERLVLDLVRERNGYLIQVGEKERLPGASVAAYERGVCYGLNTALARVEGLRDRIREPDRE